MLKQFIDSEHCELDLCPPGLPFLAENSLYLTPWVWIHYMARYADVRICKGCNMFSLASYESS